MDHGERDELVSSAAGEAARLQDVVQLLTQGVARAEAELTAAGAPGGDALDVLRRGLRQPRFGDVAGYRAELAEAQAELAAVQELRRRLSDH